MTSGKFFPHQALQFKPQQFLILGKTLNDENEFCFLHCLAGMIALNAQNCGGFYYLMNNAEIVMTNFDKKGKESGTMTYKISNVTSDGSGMTGQIHFHIGR